MIKVKEKNGKQYIYQYDTGREVIITPEEGYTVDSIEYFNDTTDLAPMGIIREVDGVLLSDIPNSFLQSENAIRVYLVMHDEEGRQTIEYKDITVIPRAKPADYVDEPDAVLTWHSLDERLKKLEAGGTGGGGMNEEQLQEAINQALAQAKESGEFKGDKGDKGDTPVKGTDYFTEADKKEIAEQAAESLVIPQTLPNPQKLTFTGSVNTEYDGSEEIQIPIMDDAQQRDIIKAIDFLFQDEDRTVTSHVFTVSEYPDLKRFRGNAIFIFESLDNNVSMFDGWISAKFFDEETYIEKSITSGSVICYTCAVYHCLRNRSDIIEMTPNINTILLKGGNKAINALPIPLTEYFVIPYNAEDGLKVKNVDFDKLTKVEIYGYKETSFTNVKRFRLLVF